MLATPTNKDALKDTVKHWRKQALPPTPEGTNVPMDIDVVSCASDASGPSTPGFSPRTFSSQRQCLTPPYTDHASSDPIPPAPPTPVALDVASKTALIVERIKEEAKVKARSSSPESEFLNMAIPDLSDSDDEDLPIAAVFAPRQNAFVLILSP